MRLKNCWVFFFFFFGVGGGVVQILDCFCLRFAQPIGSIYLVVDLMCLFLLSHTKNDQNIYCSEHTE